MSSLATIVPWDALRAVFGDKWKTRTLVTAMDTTVGVALYCVPTHWMTDLEKHKLTVDHGVEWKGSSFLISEFGA